MSTTCAGIFEKGRLIDDYRENAEILAKAFHMSSQKYFRKKKDLKKARIDTLEQINEGKYEVTEGNRERSAGEGQTGEGTKEWESGLKMKALSVKLFWIFGIVIVFLIAAWTVFMIIDYTRQLVTFGGLCGIFIGIGVLSIFFVIPSKKYKKAKAMIQKGLETIKAGKDLVQRGKDRTHKGEMWIEEGNETLRRLEKQLTALKPEQKITCLSKGYFPYWLVPYTTGTMIFDGLGKGTSEKFRLVNLNVNTIENKIEDLEKRAVKLGKLVKKSVIIKPEIAEQLDPEKEIIERPLTQTLPMINDALEDTSVITETVNVHKPGGHVSYCIKELYLHHNDTRTVYGPSVFPNFQLKDAANSVNRLMGIQSRFSSSDIHETTNKWIERIEAHIQPYEKKSKQSIERLNHLYDDIDIKFDFYIHKQICKKCFDRRKVDPLHRYSDYNLEDFIIERFRTPISLLSPHVKDVVEEMIKKKINVTLLDEKGSKFMRSIYDLDQLQVKRDRCRCKDHSLLDEEDTINIDYYANIFSNTSDSLWKLLKDPVRKRVKEEDREATRRREKFKDHLFSTLPYKQMYTQFEMESGKISAEMLGARYVLNAID